MNGEHAVWKITISELKHSRSHGPIAHHRTQPVCALNATDNSLVGEVVAVDIKDIRSAFQNNILGMRHEFTNCIRQI